MTVTDLYKNTPAYRILRTDIARGTVGHAYLLVHGDGEELRGVLRLFAKALLNADGDEKKSGRIDRETHPDCVMIPREKRAVSVDDVDGVVADSALKPMEEERKVYVIEAGAQMSAQAQNKLLKTLEEPPKGVCLLIGVTTDSFLLQTVKSRVRRLEIPPFAPSQIAEALSGEYTDKEKLAVAVSQSSGYVSRARLAYEDERFQSISALAIEVLAEMKTSRDVAKYASRIGALGDEKQFFATLKVLLRDVLCVLCGRPILYESERRKIERVAETFTEGAVLDAVQKINEAEYAAVYNANAVMQTDGVLFAILEGKYKWRKS